MKRFQGERLSSEANIAVIANDALGNYVAATPLFQALRRKFEPKSLDFYSGSRTQELWSADPNLDAGFRIFDGPPREITITAIERGPYDLVINLEASQWAKSLAAVLSDDRTYVVGNCVGPDGREDLPFASDPIGALAKDADWTADDLPARHSFLCTGFIGEIFCRLAYLEGPIPAYSVPSAVPGIEIPDLLIATSASLEEKLWPVEKWIVALEKLSKKGFRAGLLGAAQDPTSRRWRGASTEQILVDTGVVIDLRGMLTLPQVVGALDSAKAVLTLDNGIMHLACATETPVIGLFRHGFDRLWAPRVRNLSILAPSKGQWVAEIGVDRVIEEAENAF